MQTTKNSATTHKTINKTKFRCDKLPATAGTLLFFRMTKILAPVIGLAKDIDFDTGEVRDDMAIMAALSDVMAKVDPEAVTALIVELAELAEQEHDKGVYEPVIYDMTCEDDILLGAKLAMFAATTNFGSFFSGLKAKRPTLKTV